MNYVAKVLKVKQYRARHRNDRIRHTGALNNAILLRKEWAQLDIACF